MARQEQIVATDDGLLPGTPAPMRADALAQRMWRVSMRLAWFKALGTTAFMVLFFRAYFYLLTHHLGTAVVMPMTALDRWIGFQPWALPFYLSLWLYVSLPVALMTRKRDIAAYGARIGMLCLTGLAIFWIWPTQMPPTHIDWAAYGFSLLRGLDPPGNACPSLHVASALFTAIWLDRMAPGLGCGPRLRVFNAVWCSAIIYSTMAIKQHVLLDVLAGAALAVAMDRLTAPGRLRRRLQGAERAP